MKTSDLIARACEARSEAYAPYSNFYVGAAVLTRDGQVFTGANVENASYGLTVCAERIAVFKAVTAGGRDLDSICVCGTGKGWVYPCGACLQVLAEFAPDITIIVTDGEGNHRVCSLREMMPFAFVLNVEEQ